MNRQKPLPNVKVGDRVRLVHMDDPRPVAAGTEGTVIAPPNEFNIEVKWDNGRTLALATHVDIFEVIKRV